MEGNLGLKEEFVAADAISGRVTSSSPPQMGADDAYLCGFLPELSFRSVLQPLSLTFMPYSDPVDGRVSFHSHSHSQSQSQSQSQMPEMVSSAPVRYGFVSEEFSEMEACMQGEILDQKLKMPKQERLINTKDFAFDLLKLGNSGTEEASFTEPLINFFSSSPPTNPSLAMIDATDFTGHFSHLPLQKSFEPLLQPQSGYENEQLFHFHPTGSSSSSFPKNQNNSASTTVKRSAQHRQRTEGGPKRRQRMSDKTRCLEKLLPWNRRMDTAAMLEEVYKYVKFLQAQISALQAMPIRSAGSCSSSIANGNPNPNEFGGGVLARLNRQQLLEVLMNSPGAQTVLYSRGSCVYSMEQLLLLKKMAEKAAMDQQMSCPSSQY